MIQLLYSLICGSPQQHLSLLSRTLGGAITSSVLFLLLAPRFIRLLKARGICEQARDFGGLNAPGKAGTPTMGGILIYGCVLVSAIFWCRLDTNFTVIPLLAGFALGLVGLVDDLLKVRGQSSEAGTSRGIKYAGQLCVGVTVAILFLSEGTSPIDHEATRWSLFAPIFRNGLYVGSAYVLVILAVMIAASNSVNLTDGMDGLAAVPVIFVAAVLGGFGYITGRIDFATYLGYFPATWPQTGQVSYGLPLSGELMVLAAAIAGAGVGFLWFNAHPASLFMGDTGSMAIGGMLGSMAVVSKQEALFFIAGGLFVMEAASTLIQDYVGLKLLGRRILFRAPLHHNMLHRGTAETKVTVRLWIVAGLFALLALCTLKLR